MHATTRAIRIAESYDEPSAMPFERQQQQAEYNPAQGERSISEWKTKSSIDTQGREWIKVINGSDGNELLVGRFFEVIRRTHAGEKIIFKENLHVEYLESFASNV